MSSDGKLGNVPSMENNTSMGSGMVDNEDDSTLFGISQSPGSLLGTSIRSNQVESFDIESESCSVTGENPGWRLGMPWLSNNHNKNLKAADHKNQELHRYYGGIMKASKDSSTGPASASPSPTSTASSSSRHFRPFGKNKKRKSPLNAGKTKGKERNREESTKTKSTTNEKDDLTVPIARSKSSTADSIADFDDSEWTPPDSSYGAACPVCGCIPKRVRQMIEMTMITAMVFFLIYLLVTTSMKIADAHRQNGDINTANAADSYFNGGSYNRTGTSSASSTNVVTDDDVYVEKYNNYNDDGYADDATAVDDAYNDDSTDDQYAGDYNANGGSYQNQKYGFNNYGYPNRYYNKNYNYYSGYNNDDAGGGRRLLRSSLRSSQREKGR